MSMEIASYILSGIAAVSLICIIVIHIYTKIRPQFPIFVNCWFCNQSVYVSYAHRNSWNCPNCDQYNGFLRDGSYNKTIAAQHDSRLNGLVLTKKQKPLKKANGFCTSCNLNQELKIQQLAAFTSRDSNRYDEEIDQFQQHLEQAYKLCVVCEVVLERTLQKQKTWLLALKFSQLRDGINLKKDVLVGSSLGHITNLTSRFLIFALSATLFLAAFLRLDKVTGNRTHMHLVDMLLGIIPTERDFMKISPSFINLANSIAAKEMYIGVGGFVIQFLLCAYNRWKNADLLCTICWLIMCSHCWLYSESLDDVRPEWHVFNILYVCIYPATLLSTIAVTVANVQGRRGAVKEGEKIRIQRSKLYNPPQDMAGFDSDSELPPQECPAMVRSCRTPSKRRFNNPNPIPSRAERSNKTPSKRGTLDASVSSSQSDTSAELKGIFPDESSKPATAKSNKFSPLRSASDISHMLSEAVGNVSLPTGSSALPGGDGRRSVREQSVGIDRGIGNLNLGNGADVSKAKPAPTAHHYADLFKQVLSDGVRRRPLLSPSRLDLPPTTPLHRHPWDSGPLSETGCMFTPLSRSSSQSSGFASQSSQPDNTTSQHDFRSGSIDGDDADNQPQNPFYSTRSPRITPPQYAKSSRPSESRYANYNVDTPEFRKSSTNLYSQHGHMGFHKNSSYLNDTRPYEKSIFSKGARDDDNISVYSQGFDYGYRGRPPPNVYAPQPVYLSPSLFMNGPSPYAMQFCFPQARPAALWNAATYAMPRAQLELMSPESPPSRMNSESPLPPGTGETRSPSRMSSGSPDGNVSTRFAPSLHQHLITVLLVCGVLVNVVIYVGNSSWGCQYVDRMLSLLRW